MQTRSTPSATRGTHRVALLSTLLLSLLPMILHATPPSQYGIEVTPFAGYRFGGSFEDPATNATMDLDERASYGLIINQDYDSATQWEFVYSHQETELQLGPLFTDNRIFDLSVDYLSFGGTYLWREANIQPFIGAALGITYMDPQDARYDSETRFMLQLSGGYKYFFTPNLGVRIEARGYATALDTSGKIFCGDGACIAQVQSRGFGQIEINAGLNFRF